MCGAHEGVSWGLWKTSRMTDCVTEGMSRRRKSLPTTNLKGLSDQCLDCVGKVGKYGYDKCKWSCLSNWCSKDCLECTAKYEAEADKCFGFAPPKPDNSGKGCDH